MFGLTAQERKVILFLASVALLGAGIDYLNKRHAQARIITCVDQNIGKINLNQADKEALISIPGIGEKLAGRIIEYRRENNGFESLDELRKIKGMTDYRYDQLVGYIYAE